MPIPASSIIFTRRPQHIMKCNTHIHHNLYILRLLSKGCESAAPAIKGILNASSGARKSIIEEPLVLFRRCCSERLHHPLVESKCVVPDYEIRYGPIVIRQRFLLLDIGGAGYDCVSKCRLIPQLGNRICSWCSNLYPRKPVVCVNVRMEHN